jgi:hypothetical protein
MHFDPVQVDIDGSLRNPYVVGAVLIWAAVLTLLALGVLRWPNRLSVVAVAVLLVVACAVTPRVIRELLNLAYNGRVGGGSIGVMGGPPAWLPSLVAAVGLTVVSAVRHRKAVSRAA